MILPIILYKNKILRKKNKNIRLKKNLNKIIKNMFETMYYYKGIGLSAPQIGKNINLFIISINNKKMIFINSKIIKYSKKKIISNEGCLSIPNFYANIKRNKLIKVEYYDNKWEKHNKIFKNNLSIIYQHEYDHIKGKLIIDYLN
ncbi:peptide deformylase [Candidatus Shikimatogenerans bostrichidophilus]|uniref:peptide deformylase n=1 Tax=Candidatus Shikimatogenerans bostrichidophilus TaxID=2943807 RepID=UPI0029668444